MCDCEPITELIESFGLVRRPDRPSKHEVIGVPPANWCALTTRGVYAGDCSAGDALHECLHGVLGPLTLRCEVDMMAVEWATAHARLSGDDLRTWRQDFADYGFEWRRRGDSHVYEVVGRDDGFLWSDAWAQTVKDAKALGWLDKHGAPSFDLGMHPDWCECK